MDHDETRADAAGYRVLCQRYHNQSAARARITRRRKALQIDLENWLALARSHGNHA